MRKLHCLLQIKVKFLLCQFNLVSQRQKSLGGNDRYREGIDGNREGGDKHPKLKRYR